MLRFLLLRKEKSTSCKIFFFKENPKTFLPKEELLHNLLIYDKALSITVDMEKKNSYKKKLPFHTCSYKTDKIVKNSIHHKLKDQITTFRTVYNLIPASKNQDAGHMN